MGTTYVKKQRTVRLPAASDLQVNEFSTGVVDVHGSYILNGVIRQYTGGNYYVTQRPGASIFYSPSDASVTDVRGRGIFYWKDVPALYFVNNDTVYQDDYSTALAQTFTAGGTEKVEIAELGDYLVFVDAEGQEMWYIDSAAATTLVAMTASPDFDALPQNNSKTLAHGVAVLNQTMYVLDTDGQVWNCAVADPTDWSDATFYTTAERDEDQGVYICKHYDHIAVFGTRTIEFFYDAANPTGSPLTARKDIFYNVGCADPNSIWQHGDDIFFLGINASGQIQPYLLSNFQLTPLASTSVTAFLTSSKLIDGIKTIGAGTSSGGEIYYMLSIYELDGDSNIDTSATYVYNLNSKIWTEWEFAGDAIDNFPLVGFTIPGASTLGYGIFSSGEIIYLEDKYVPYDANKISSGAYFTPSGYVSTGYVLGSATDDSNPITMIVRLDNWDHDNRDWKFCHQLRFVGDETESSNLMTVRWNDGNNIPDTYTGSRTIDLINALNKLTRLGRFKSRSFECEYSGTDQIRMVGLDIDITEGTH